MALTCAGSTTAASPNVARIWARRVSISEKWPRKASFSTIALKVEGVWAKPARRGNSSNSWRAWRGSVCKRRLSATCLGRSARDMVFIHRTVHSGPWVALYIHRKQRGKKEAKTDGIVGGVARSGAAGSGREN